MSLQFHRVLENRGKFTEKQAPVSHVEKVEGVVGQGGARSASGGGRYGSQSYPFICPHTLPSTHSAHLAGLSSVYLQAHHYSFLRISLPQR